MSEYPHTCNFCGVPYRIYSADEGTCSPESEYYALTKALEVAKELISQTIKNLEEEGYHRPNETLENLYEFLETE